MRQDPSSRVGDPYELIIIALEHQTNAQTASTASSSMGYFFLFDLDEHLKLAEQQEDDV